jgi:hypothetical protein
VGVVGTALAIAPLDAGGGKSQSFIIREFRLAIESFTDAHGGIGRRSDLFISEAAEAGISRCARASRLADPAKNVGCQRVVQATSSLRAACLQRLP